MRRVQANFDLTRRSLHPWEKKGNSSNEKYTDLHATMWYRKVNFGPNASIHLPLPCISVDDAPVWRALYFVLGDMRDRSCTSPPAFQVF